jgi:hypothetical protein
MVQLINVLWKKGKTKPNIQYPHRMCAKLQFRLERSGLKLAPESAHVVSISRAKTLHERVTEVFALRFFALARTEAGRFVLERRRGRVILSHSSVFSSRQKLWDV